MGDFWLCSVDVPDFNQFPHTYIKHLTPSFFAVIGPVLSLLITIIVQMVSTAFSLGEESGNACADV
jgi:hypothetical protein